MKLRVGTRRSPLAVTQSRQGLQSVSAAGAGFDWELVEIVSTGDRIQDRPLRDAGGKGLFVKELDDALLGGDIDCAVHSMKDVPSELADGIRMSAVLERADPRDLLITRSGETPAGLPSGSVVGTTSLRRSAQLCAVNPGVRIEMLRGNVQTRLGRLLAGDFDATFLASAGLSRLGVDVEPAKAVALEPFDFIPAPGQGALAITTRADDTATADLLAAGDHGDSRAATEAERAFARVFGGGCHLPLGAYAVVKDGVLRLAGVVVEPDGSRSVRDEIDGSIDEAGELGRTLGERLLAAGAGEIVAAVEAAG